MLARSSLCLVVLGLAVTISGINAAKETSFRRQKNCLKAQCFIRHIDHKLNRETIMTGTCKDNQALYVNYIENTGELLTHDGLCLGAPEVEDENGYLDVVVEPCHGGVHQEWDLVTEVSMEMGHQVRNRAHDLCADVKHQHWNTDVILWKCKGPHNYKPLNQAWHNFGKAQFSEIAAVKKNWLGTAMQEFEELEEALWS